MVLQLMAGSGSGRASGPSLPLRLKHHFPLLRPLFIGGGRTDTFTKVSAQPGFTVWSRHPLASRGAGGCSGSLV